MPNDCRSCPISQEAIQNGCKFYDTLPQITAKVSLEQYDRRDRSTPWDPGWKVHPRRCTQLSPPGPGGRLGQHLRNAKQWNACLKQ